MRRRERRSAEARGKVERWPHACRRVGLLLLGLWVVVVVVVVVLLLLLLVVVVVVIVAAAAVFCLSVSQKY